MNLVHCVSALLLGSVLVGCGHSGGQPEQASTPAVTAVYPDNPLIRSNYQAADTLLKQLQGRLPTQHTTLLVATLVNIDDLEQSSTLGRLIVSPDVV